jgi:hypothetical protein
MATPSADCLVVFKAMMSLFVDKGGWKVPTLNVLSDVAPPFSIKVNSMIRGGTMLKSIITN